MSQANIALAAANDREAARFGLALEAIKLFHGEVGDDLVLKADQFKPLRDKLLRGAADFYGKLEELLKGQPDRASRRTMGNAYFELGGLIATIGDKPAGAGGPPQGPGGTAGPVLGAGRQRRGPRRCGEKPVRNREPTSRDGKDERGPHPRRGGA